MSLVTLATHAMATRFEVVLHGDNPVALRAAGEEAMAEVQRLEAQLSLFRPESEVAHLNARAAFEPVRISPEVFTLLERARHLTEVTRGAFDITIAPLLRCWGFLGGGGHPPDEAAVEEARSVTGMHLVHLHPGKRTVTFERPGVMLDLGAIGKGYAVECAVELLREAGVQSALLHGGTSTVYALGTPPGESAWVVGLENSGLAEHRLEDLPKVQLRDEALSVSAAWGKCFQSEGEVFGHVMDPATGRPARRCILSAITAVQATDTDALSTALLVGGEAADRDIRCVYPQSRTLWWSGGPGQGLQTRPGPDEWGLCR